MNFTFVSLLELIGALGFFIFGMKVMSEGIQKVAGTQMRRILGAMTSNRFLGVFTGFLITALVQSSSATTVMTVSFVNAGLLSLVESAGVMMGANVGTTVTAWLISIFGFKVKIASIALPIIAIGFPLLFIKRGNFRSWGEVFIGFALLFLGLNELKGAVPDLKNNPEVLQFLADYSDMGILSTLIFIGIGTLITIVVQSSSAAMALTLVMCNNGWIPFDVAAAMVLGENIGTTITAELASIVGNVHAKRSARIHSMFNIIGVTWMIFALPYFLKMIEYFTLQSGLESPYTNSHSIPIALSYFHTAFNVSNVILTIGFVPWLVKAAERTVKSRGEDETYHLEFIGSGITHTPELSLLEAKKEIAKFGKIDRRALGFVHTLLNSKDRKEQEEMIAKIAKYEEITDRIEAEVVLYLTELSEAELTAATSARVRGMLNMVNELESIGDICYQMSKILERKIEQRIYFIPEQRDSLNSLFSIVDEAFENMTNNLHEHHDEVTMDSAIEIEERINKERDRVREKNFEMIEKGKVKPPSGFIFNDLLASFEKIGDHIFRVSESVTGENVE